jgi:hypothetical protein
VCQKVCQTFNKLFNFSVAFFLSSSSR